MAYSTINNISKKVDKSFFLQFLNDENRMEHEINLDDENDPVVIRFNQIADEVAEEIDNFLRSRYKLPLVIVPQMIQSISDDRVIYNVKKRRLRETIAESGEQAIYDNTTRLLQMIQRGDIILNTEQISPSNKGLAGEIKINKTNDDRIFNNELWKRY